MEALRLIGAGLVALAAAVLLGWALRAGGADLHKAATHVDFTGRPVTVVWDPVDRATHYVWRIRSFERGALVVIGGQTQHTTDAASLTFTIPYQGHFIVEVMAVDADGNTSDWAISTRDEFARVEDRPQGWWIYGRLAPAGAIDIEP